MFYPVRRLYGITLTVLIALAAASCQGDSAPDNSRLLQAFRNGDVGVWVTGRGTVTQILGDETQDGRTHQRFNVEIDSELRLLVAHRVGEAGRVPVKEGDKVTFRGRYEFNASGGTVTTGRLGETETAVGWVEHRGKQYD